MIRKWPPSFHPRVWDELSQSLDSLIFKPGNQMETGLFKRGHVSLTRCFIAQSDLLLDARQMRSFMPLLAFRTLLAARR